MNRCIFSACNLDDTDRLGSILAESLEDGTVVALQGTLGAGKTRLVQAIAANCGVPRHTVVSPTFVLCHEYHGTRSIYHFDAYRLKGDDEFQQLGAQEYMDSSGLVFIEWAERVRDSLPDDRLEIHIDVTRDDERTFEILGFGERAEQMVNDIRSRLAK